jgi:hypothetical protein
MFRNGNDDRKMVLRVCVFSILINSLASSAIFMHGIFVYTSSADEMANEKATTETVPIDIALIAFALFSFLSILLI